MEPAVDNIDTQKKDFKSKKFFNEVIKLIDAICNVVKSKHGNFIPSDAETIIDCAQAYKNIFTKMDPHEHYMYFEKLILDFRSEIVRGHIDDMWLRLKRSKPVIVQFGYNLLKNKDLDNDKRERLEKRRILISDAYKIALELEETTKSRIAKLGNDDINGINKVDLVYPRIILLHLYRIFYILLEDSKDKDDIADFVKKLETELSVPEKDQLVGSEPWKKPEPAPAASGGESSLFGMATSLMQKFGLPVPEGIKTPSNDELTGVIKQVLSSPATSNLLKGVMSSIPKEGEAATPEGMQNILTNIVQSVSDPNTLSTIRTTVEEAAKQHQSSESSEKK